MIKNAFFIQKAVVEALLLNNASALEICAYLVISKYTDRSGFHSGVGFKTIRERLGIGPNKAKWAMERLLRIEHNGLNLLKPLRQWLKEERSVVTNHIGDSGWIREWIDSNYTHRIWLNNSLVGKHRDPDCPPKYREPDCPLRYFLDPIRQGRKDSDGNPDYSSIRDNHARMLLLLYLHHNKHYPGVHHRFASKVPVLEGSFIIDNLSCHKSRIDETYHISHVLIRRMGIDLPVKEIWKIIDDLVDYGFFDISLSVIGHSTPRIISSEKKPRKDRIYSEDEKEQIKRIIAFKAAVKGKRKTYRVANIPIAEGSKTCKVGLKEIYTSRKLSNPNLRELQSPSDDTDMQIPKFIYRLDYKSAKKKKMDISDCLATSIEAAICNKGLDSASRKGKFYGKYWWFEPEKRTASLLGILKAVHVPTKDIPVRKKTTHFIERIERAKEWYEIRPVEPVEIFNTLV